MQHEVFLNWPQSLGYHCWMWECVTWFLAHSGMKRCEFRSTLPAFAVVVFELLHVAVVVCPFQTVMSMRRRKRRRMRTKTMMPTLVCLASLPPAQTDRAANLTIHFHSRLSSAGPLLSFPRACNLSLNLFSASFIPRNRQEKNHNQLEKVAVSGWILS